MTALPPNPDPSNTPGIEPGGGVPPGETPPDSGHTSATSNPDPQATARRALTPMAVAAYVAVGVLVLLFVGTAVSLILRMFGVWD